MIEDLQGNSCLIKEPVRCCMVFRGCAPMYLSPPSKGQTFQEEGLVYSFFNVLKNSKRAFAEEPGNHKCY